MSSVQELRLWYLGTVLHVFSSMFLSKNYSLSLILHIKSVMSAFSSVQSIFCGVRQNLSPVDERLTSVSARAWVDRLITMLLSSGLVRFLPARGFG